jgi:hypothetical protein
VKKLRTRESPRFNDEESSWSATIIWWQSRPSSIWWVGGDSNESSAWRSIRCAGFSNAHLLPPHPEDLDSAVSLPGAGQIELDD